MHIEVLDHFEERIKWILSNCISSHCTWGSCWSRWMRSRSRNLLWNSLTLRLLTNSGRSLRNFLFFLRSFYDLFLVFGIHFWRKILFKISSYRSRWSKNIKSTIFVWLSKNHRVSSIFFHFELIFFFHLFCLFKLFNSSRMILTMTTQDLFLTWRD